MDLAERLLDFSARVGRVVDALPGTRMGRHIAGQLVRSGTSPAPNYEEACGAESRRDFIHKLNVSFKEMRESYSWLRLIVKCELLPAKQLCEIIDEADQLRRILAQSIVTAKRNNKDSSEAIPPSDKLIGRQLTEIEAFYIQKTLELTNGNFKEAADTLDIDEKLFAEKAEQYGIRGNDGTTEAED